MSEASRTLHSSEIYRTHYFVETRGPMAHRGGAAAMAGTRRPRLLRAAALAGVTALLIAAVLAWVGNGDPAPAAQQVTEEPTPLPTRAQPGTRDQAAAPGVAKPAAATRRTDGQR